MENQNQVQCKFQWCKRKWQLGIYMIKKCQKGTEIDEKVEGENASFLIDKTLKNGSQLKFRYWAFYNHDNVHFE